MRRLGIVLLAVLLIAGCGGGSKAASTSTTTTNSAPGTADASKVTRLTDCLTADEALKEWGSHLENLPSLTQIEAGTAVASLNHDYQATLTVEHALHTLEKEAPQTSEAVHSYNRTLEDAEQGIRGLMASTGDIARAESAMSELAGVADEYKQDQQALNQACTGE